MAKAVILAGGQGERFWPLTHREFPKYRIKMHSKRSLLQQTFDRLVKVYGKNSVYVVTTQPHAKMIAEELPELPREHMIIEPMRKNTCAAIYLSCEMLRRQFGDNEIVSFFAADHLIRDEKAFHATMTGSIRLAAKSPVLLTIGIKPDHPAVGFGYIEKGERISKSPAAFRVKRFTEKPALAKAIKLVKSGRYYWNAGIFTWKLETFFSSMKRYCPAFTAVFDARKLKASYERVPSISIDYALMEKAKNVAVCPTAMDWCDIGCWDSWLDKSPLDKKQVYAEGFYYHQDVSDSLVVNQTATPLIVMGLKGIVVVQTERGTLICPKGRSQEAALLARKL